jgi:hypothetical protein
VNSALDILFLKGGGKGCRGSTRNPINSKNCLQFWHDAQSLRGKTLDPAF